MPNNADDVSQLVIAAKAAESNLAELLAKYRPYLRLLAEQQLGSRVRRREDASDVVQQTELEVHQGFGQFRGSTEAEFSAWIKQILRRNVVTVCRGHHAAKRDVARERYFVDGEASASITWMQPAAGGPSPSQQVMRGEAALRLAAALESLPEKQQEAVRLRHLEGMKIDEVAQALGVTEGAAAGLIRRGVEALRKQFAGESSIL